MHLRRDISKYKFIIPVLTLSILLLLFSCDKIKELIGKGGLTEEEQDSFIGCLDPRLITKEEALKYLPLLIKGDPESIRWYSEYEEDEGRTFIAEKNSLYENDICVSVRLLARENDKEGYNWILKVIKKKTSYPRARACAITAIGQYGEMKRGVWHGDKRSIPVLKRAVNNKDPEIRLRAAEVLLSLDEADVALPVLDELAKAGIPQSTDALGSLFALVEKAMGGRLRIVRSDTKLWDERGREILVKALSYPSDEVNAFSARLLANMGIEKELVEDTAIKILEQIKNKKKKDFKTFKELESYRRTGYNAIVALEKVKSTSGKDILKAIIDNSDDSVLKRRAQEALEKI